MVHRWAGFYPDQVTAAALLQEHMPVAWSQKGYPGSYGVAVPCLPDLHLRDLIEPPGEACGELLGHVLDDQRARGGRRQLFEYGLDRLGTAGGGSNRQQFIRGLDMEERCRAGDRRLPGSLLLSNL